MLAILPLNSIRQMKSMLIAKAIADTPKKNPEGEYRSDALEPAVTYTAQSSQAQSNATAKRRRKATAPVNTKPIETVSDNNKISIPPTWGEKHYKIKTYTVPETKSTLV